MAAMRKHALVLGCVVALGICLAAQTSNSAKPSKTPAATTTKTAATPQAQPTPTPAPATQAPSPFKDQKEKESYAVGLNLGSNLRLQSIDVSPDLLIQGLRDGLSGGKTQMTDEEVRSTLMQFQTELQSKRQEKMKQLAETNKQEGDTFLAQNKTKQGVVTLPSGLQYKIITPGTGAKPAATDTVTVNYRGTFINGTEFDSSYKSGQPATFPVNGVIKGWTEALQLMPTGSKWQLFIPPDLAYGEQGRSSIPPNSTLVFEVELLSIQKQSTPPTP